MKINWTDYGAQEHVLAWFLVEAMSRAGIEQFGAFSPESLDVVLTVNGIEVPITEPMEFLQSQLDDIKRKGRAQGREEAYRQLQSKVDEWLEESALEDSHE